MASVKKILPLFLWIRLSKIRRKIISKDYTLIKDPKKAFECLYHVKDVTWDTMYTPELYDIAKERTLVAIYPAIDIYKIPNAIINQDSDIILTDRGAWWDKYNDEDFLTLAQPADSNLVSFNNKSVKVARARKKECIKGRVIHLTGVYSFAWSHCLFQYICKMFFAAEAGLLDDEITLLTNDYHDENLEYIFNNFLIKYPNVKRLLTNQGVDYYCEELICMRSTGTNYNEAIVFWDYRLVIPKLVVDKLHEYISIPLIEKIKNNPVKHKKLYLTRHSNRKLNNTEEIECYFKELGFFFLEGAELTLEEKVDLFYHAEIIVGPHSSAWQNLIFCNNVKCMQLVNNRYAAEMLFYTMAKSNVLVWLNVCGQDNNKDRRSDYTIPLSKIKSAYKQLLQK